MRHAIVLICCTSFLLILGFGVIKMSDAIVLDRTRESSKMAAGTGCLSDADVVNALQTMSWARSPAEVDQARETILAESRKSLACRKSVIANLMKAMDKSNLDINREPAMYYVWRDGAELLGELKAAEALDLLISHLDLSDGLFSTTMSHQPALRGVIEIGEDAIPKLEVVLRHNSDPRMRNYAVYCISAIGGPSAMRVLKEALPSESDRCVNQFIRVSVNNLDNKDYRLKENVKWFSAFICK